MLEKQENSTRDPACLPDDKLNPLPNAKILDVIKFNAFADVKLNFSKNEEFFFSL